MLSSTHLTQVKPALDAIRALGPVLEDHLQLLLPALNRLIVPGGSGLPLAIQEETLATMQVGRGRFRCAACVGCTMVATWSTKDNAAQQSVFA